MSRKPKEIKKVNTKIRIREDLKKEAKEKNFNFSKIMEDELKRRLKKE